jgi:hypothetical protein
MTFSYALGFKFSPDLQEVDQDKTIPKGWSVDTDGILERNLHSFVDVLKLTQILSTNLRKQPSQQGGFL